MWATLLRLSILSFGLAWGAPFAAGQEPASPEDGPPRKELFETDSDGDAVPDGWYNLRDARLVKGGIGGGARCLRFENFKIGRPSRASRAFKVEGKTTEALIIGLWIRGEGIRTGERAGEDPGLMIDFLGDQLRELRRGTLGPWTKNAGARWSHVAKRIPVPAEARDAIMSIGLLGATGTLEVDGLTIDVVARGDDETVNLLSNGDLELGDPDPPGWDLQNGARLVYPGHNSNTAIELSKAGSQALAGVVVPVSQISDLDLSLWARASGVRGAGGASAVVYFLNQDGKLLAGQERGVPAVRWAGSSDWRAERARIRVPANAARAVLQIEKPEAGGWLRVDDLQIQAATDPQAFAWRPYRVEDDTTGWKPYTPAAAIKAGSALDASTLLDAPAGKRGFVVVKDGRLSFEKGGRARFFGVVAIPPTAYQEKERADSLADRLARSGVNLVRLGDLDSPLGPTRSLFDDTRDDTKALDPEALAKLDHLIAALKAKGIYVALELMSGRRFRAGDGFPTATRLPPGGGPAAAFDPDVRARAIEAADSLLSHVNPETGLALIDEPALAWVTLNGELSLFNLIDDPSSLPPESVEALKTLAQKAGMTGRRFWKATEAAQWKAEAAALRKLRLRAPIAGDSHWRREADFVAAQLGGGLDLIDDRLYWTPPSWGDPMRRSLLFSQDGGLATEASKKRKESQPYVVGQWCAHTDGAWALTFEGADLMLATQTARVEDWDAIVRRGVFTLPGVWGSAATGTGGDDDIFVLPEVANGNPQIFALLPHAASLFLRDPAATGKGKGGRPASTRPHAVPGWSPTGGLLVVDSPHTQVFAGWPAGKAMNTETMTVETDASYAVFAASSLDAAPLDSCRRILVTAVAQVQPTGFRWADPSRREVGDAGRPPLLQEPVSFKLTWKRKGKLKAFALDNAGVRTGPVALEPTADGIRLVIEGRTPTVHWELAAD